MVPDQLEKPRVTEIQVRMDCNGCVQKIKKALHGINGIYDLYIDFPQQKLTIIGWADPEKIMKAIKKTRKIATLCSHTEQQPQQPDQQEQQQQQQQPTDQQPPQADQPPPPEATPSNPPPPEAAPPPPPEQAPPAQPPPPEATPPPEAQPSGGQPGHVDPHQDQGRTQVAQVIPPKDVGEVHHVIYHHAPPDHHGYGYGSYGYRNNGNYWNKYSNSHHQHSGPGLVQQHHQEGPQQVPVGPVYMATTHSYNTYRPSPYVTEYHRDDHNHDRHPNHHQCVPSPPRPTQQTYDINNYYNYGPRNYRERYNYYYPDQEPPSSQYHYTYNGNSSASFNNGNIASIFSDENPNACSIV